MAKTRLESFRSAFVDTDPKIAEEHAAALVTLAQSVAPHLIAAAEALSRLQEALAGAHEITRSDKALKSAYIVARSALAPLLQPTE